MVAYSFQPRFVEPMCAGTKRQTIRAERRRHAQWNEKLQLYTGMRTKQCKLIGTARCRGVVPITLRMAPAPEVGEVQFGDRIICLMQDLDAFARLDGFADWWDMRRFWRDKHGGTVQWSGVLIRWDGFEAA
jgi:hypothetical protein